MERQYVKRALGQRKGRPLAYRKWNESETLKLIEYLKSEPHENFSGRIYYTKFLEKYEMDKNINWQLVKSKVRNLKSKYMKAVEWRAKTDSIDVQRICPFFNDLSEVFYDEVPKMKADGSAAAEESAPETTYSLDSLSDLGSSIKIELGDTEFIDYNLTLPTPTLTYYNSTNNNNSPTTPTAQAGTDAKAKRCYNKTPIHKKIASAKYCIANGVANMANGVASSNNSKLGSLSDYQREILQIHKTRLALEEKKFVFEKEKSLQELALKKHELEKDERLKTLEIESKERIAMKELEYKYSKETTLT